MRERAIAVMMGLALAAAAWADDPASLEGTWKFTGAGNNGKDDPPETVSTLSFEVKGSAYRLLEEGKETEVGTLKLGHEGAFDTIDWVIASGDDRGKTQKGIYRVTGATATFAYLPAGQDARPRELANKVGQSFAAIRRDAPAPTASPK